MRKQFNWMVLTITLSSILTLAISAFEDPFIWLEEVDSEDALNWVREHNQPTLEQLSATDGFEQKKSDALEILTASDRIVYGSIRGDWVYNLWQTADQPQGVWRRTKLEDYRTQANNWEILLDLDKLSAEEGINWVWKGVDFISDSSNRCLVELSDGGKDAVEIREFDIQTLSFVSDGFLIPEAKTNFNWATNDSIWLATKFDDDSVTESGYPRILKLLKRSQKLSESKTIFAAPKSHVSITPLIIKDGDASYSFVIDRNTFFEYDLHYITDDHETIKIPKQRSDSIEAIYKGQVVIQTRKDWTLNGKTHPQGALVSFDLQDFLKTRKIGEVTTLFEPTDSVAVKQVGKSNQALIVNFNDNVTNRLSQYSYEDGKWKTAAVELPENGTISIVDEGPTQSIALVEFESFLSPPSLIELHTDTKKWEIIQQLPERFDSSDLVVEQKHAVSADGTKVPYFIVRKKEIKYDGKNATYLYGYGGFEISLNPSYLSSLGKLWVETGGVYVLSNIRGGGEFGPRWHQSALKLNRQRAYDDFHAIAENLIEEKITSPKHLGIGGGSNGGLLVGVAFTQRPDLYNAVFCAVPLLDMLRYHELPPGASWIAEYGDPRIQEEYDYIAGYSPYQNLDAGKTYPKVFFYTSTRDDRVHPAHARKMAAMMEKQEHPFFYFERIEGGHAGGANLSQYAELYALQFSYLEMMLK